MIDMSTETLLTLAQAARLRPASRQGRPTHICTIYRWILRGERGCRLEAIRLGGTLYTSHEAMQWFADRLTVGSAYGAAQNGRTDRRLAQVTLLPTSVCEIPSVFATWRCKVFTTFLRSRPGDGGGAGESGPDARAALFGRRRVPSRNADEWCDLGPSCPGRAARRRRS